MTNDYHFERSTRQCAHLDRQDRQDKWAKNANIWPKMTKHAYFGPNMAVFGPKILIFTVVCKSFGTHITENLPRHLVCIIFWSGMGPNWPKKPLFGQICQFGPNLAVFGQKSSFLGEMEYNFLYPHIREPMRHSY